MSTSRRGWKSQSWLTEHLPRAEPPLPYAFPMVAEQLKMLEESTLTPLARRPVVDIFDGLLGDLAPLLADFSLHPQKYGELQGQLLERLASGSTSLMLLTPSERQFLNLAVLDYAGPNPVALPPPSVVPAKEEAEEAPDPDELSQEEQDLEAERSEALHDAVLPTFWWLPKELRGQ
jgi:hypothetical protein